jgi:hypothetical protein
MKGWRATAHRARRVLRLFRAQCCGDPRAFAPDLAVRGLVPPAILLKSPGVTASSRPACRGKPRGRLTEQSIGRPDQAVAPAHVRADAVPPSADVGLQALLTRKSSAQQSLHAAYGTCLQVAERRVALCVDDQAVRKAACFARCRPVGAHRGDERSTPGNASLVPEEHQTVGDHRLESPKFALRCGSVRQARVLAGARVRCRGSRLDRVLPRSYRLPCRSQGFAARWSWNVLMK